MTRNERNQRYAQSEKGKAAHARAQAKYQQKEEGGEQRKMVSRTKEMLPTPKKYMDRNDILNEMNRRVWEQQNEMMARQAKGCWTSMEQLDFFIRWIEDGFDILDEQIAVIYRDKRTTPDEWHRLYNARLRAIEKMRMLYTKLSGDETVEQRKYRCSQGLFMNDDDRAFLKALLFPS